MFKSKLFCAHAINMLHTKIPTCHILSKSAEQFLLQDMQKYVADKHNFIYIKTEKKLVIILVQQRQSHHILSLVIPRYIFALGILRISATYNSRSDPLPPGTPQIRPHVCIERRLRINVQYRQPFRWKQMCRIRSASRQFVNAGDLTMSTTQQAIRTDGDWIRHRNILGLHLTQEL